MKKVFSKLTAALLAVLMLVSMVPAMSLTASAAVMGGKFENAQLDIVSDKESTLAPGVTENQYTVYDKNGKQVKMFVATADMNVESVKAFSSYKDMNPTSFGIAKMTEHVDAFNQLAAAGDPYYQGTVVVGINGSYYNMTTGQPTGIFVMNGVVGNANESAGYFAIMKDGSMKIGVKGDYATDKDNIQEAMGIYTMLIVDGKICDGLDASTKYPRQTIGITADNKLIIMSADGSQAPTSVGLTVLEQAQVMQDLGCVWAGHLDGGGSMSYASKAEGSDEFKITNNPSDGSERSVANGFIIVSTAVASYDFDHVTYEIANEYVTPNSKVALSVTGVSSTGHNATIPAGVTYEVTNGSYADGVVTVGSVGDTVITAMYNGNACGSATIHVVNPDISFAQSSIIVPYGKEFELPIVATTNGGLNTVLLKDGDVIATLSDPAMGTLDGITFTACDVSTGHTGGTITLTSKFDSTKTSTATITFGKASDIIYDFENLTTADLTKDNGWRINSHYIDRKLEGGGGNALVGNMERSSIEIVTAETGKVRNGNQAIALNLDYTFCTAAGGKDIDFWLPQIKLEGATAIGMWVYFPVEEVDDLRFRLHEYAPVQNGGDSAVYANFGELASKVTEDGWYYVEVNVNDNWEAFSRICFAISDANNTMWNTYSKFTLYIDDITVDYSNATEDREIPTFDNIYIGGSAEGTTTVMQGQTLAGNSISIYANAKENLNGNYTGLNIGSAKVYVDGVELGSGVKSNENGVISVDNLSLTNGVHNFRFEIQDNAGNVGMIERYVIMNSTAGSVYLTAPDKALVPTGSIQYFDLVAKEIEKVSSITTTIDLDGVSEWEMEGTVTTYGFTTTYNIDKGTNTLVLTVTKTGDVEVTGEQVLVSIPVRAWYFKGYTDPEFIAAGVVSDNPDLVDSYYCMTPHGAWYSDGTRLVRIEVQVTEGTVVFADSSVDSFASEIKYVTTEQNRYRAAGHYDADGVWHTTSNNSHRQDKWSDHIHVAGTATDKAATCTEAGYTGRVFCVGCGCGTVANLNHECDTHAGCDSVIEWGTTIPATGHSYAVVDGALKCTCGKLFTGTWTDGKDYVDGVCQADGWVGDSYYKDGVKLTGVQLVDGFYYDFGENGVCANQIKYTGLFYDDEVSAWRYSKLGELTGGWQQIDDDWYYFESLYMYAVAGTYKVGKATFTFNEQGMTKGAWYTTEEGTRFYYGPSCYRAYNPGYMKFIEIEGVTYNFDYDGYVTPGVWALRDSTAHYKRVFEFAEDGSLIKELKETGAVVCEDAIYFINSEGVVPLNSEGTGIMKDGKDYYYVLPSGKVAQNSTRWVTAKLSNGLVSPGEYTFGADGKMEKPYTGIKNVNGVDYYYLEGNVMTNNTGLLVKVGDDIYYVTPMGKIKKDFTMWITATKANGLVSPGEYTFGADGKMEIPYTGIKNVDGVDYYYVNGAVDSTGSAHLIKVGDDIYYVTPMGKIKKNFTMWINEAKANGLVVPGEYTFDENGKMIIS